MLYLLLLAFVSGMRFSEMIALKRKDFDFEKNLMTISKARGYSSNMGDGEQETKSIASERVIEINKKQ
nr:tyrosine-type recombinase/integrase [Sporosarcina quadrami]